MGLKGLDRRERVASFREEIVTFAILYTYEEFQEAVLELVPPGFAEHIAPNLHEIYLDVQEEMAVDLAKREQLQSRCKAL